MGLALGGERPPGARGAAFHEIDGGEEDVDYARVLPASDACAEVFVEFEGVLAEEVAGEGYADGGQVADGGGADVWKVGKAGNG